MQRISVREVRTSGTDNRGKDGQRVRDLIISEFYLFYLIKRKSTSAVFVISHSNVNFEYFINRVRSQFKFDFLCHSLGTTSHLLYKNG